MHPKRRTVFMVLWAVSLGLLLFSSPSLAVLTQEEHHVDDIDVQTTQLVVIVSAGVFDVYQEEELSKLMRDEPTSPTHTYDSFDQVSADVSINVVYIVDDSVLDALPSSTIDALSAWAAAGSFIGVYGDGAHMREVLNITDETDKAWISDPVPTVFFTYGVPDGSREDLLISLETHPTPGSILSVVIDWVHWIFEKHQRVPQSDGAWNATYSKDWRGNMDGGSYRFLVNVFKLNTTNPSYDWYRVDTSYQSAITSYKADTGRCGWFTYSMNLTAQVDTSNGGMLYEYMPTGTVSNRTEGFSIGGSLETGGAGMSASYSMSYDTPDVTIQDTTNYVTNTAKWLISMVGPNYTWYPFYSEPANVARSSYQVQPSLIVQVPKNQSMKLSLHPEIGQQNDELTYYFVVLSVKSKRMYWTSSNLNIQVGP